MSNTKMRRKVFLAVVAVVLTVAAFAGCGKSKENTKELLQKGNAAYKAKNYETAVKHYKKAAEQGDALAQNMLALCYDTGDASS